MMTDLSMNTLRRMLMRRMKPKKSGPLFLKKREAPAPILFQPMPYLCASKPYVVTLPKWTIDIQLVFHCITGVMAAVWDLATQLAAK